MTNGHHKNGGNGHANGSGKAGAPAPPAAARFFDMTREETEAMYRELSHVTLGEALARAVVRRMGQTLEASHG